MGIDVTSRWLDEPHSAGTQVFELPEDLNAQYAIDDLMDVAAADLLVFFSMQPTTPMVRGGRHVEFGYALGIKKDILVVGPKENIFHYLPQVHFADTWTDAIKLLGEKVNVG